MLKWILFLSGFFLVSCSLPQQIVAKRYQESEKPTEIKTIFQNELSSLVYAISEDKNCTYIEKYLLVKTPPENSWDIIKEEGLRDCSKKEDALLQQKYLQWRSDQKSWHLHKVK